ncbi:ATP-binding cassette domain-containing protein, partial [bacterium]|nr:ATP-binding cassette domain-containing protein [bacterium]
IILKLRNENHAIIMITHKLNEVMKIGDRVTILRRGKKVITLDVKNLNKDELTSHMINSDCKTISSKTSTNTSNEVLLKIHDLNVINARGLKAVSNLSFEIHKNEIFGIAGVSGQGQIELAEAIYGLKEYTGMITLSGKNYKNRSASLSLLEKVAYIPADRLKFGIAKTLSISENLMLKTKLPVNKTKLLNYKKIQKMSEELIEKFQIDGNSNVIAGICLVEIFKKLFWPENLN